MTELRTLKDIEWELGTIPENKLEQIDERVEPLFKYKLALKQEAIKWVKECSVGYSWKENDKRCDGCKWFIKFFNLTEEDLK